MLMPDIDEFVACADYDIDNSVNNEDDNES